MSRVIHGRISKIDVERLSVDCTSKSSVLADKNNERQPRKDAYYDQAAEDRDMNRDEETKKQNDRAQYINRVIVHPAFANKSYSETLKIMTNESVKQGS